VGVSTESVASVGGISVEVGKAVSVGRRGAEVGVGEEQEMRRRIQRAESKIRGLMCGGIGVF
jgi:hypothetical protein